MKKISFFYILNNFILVIGLLLTMFISSFLLVSYTYFDKKKEKISYLESIEIYKEDKVSDFKAYLNENSCVIFFNTLKKEEDLFLIEYGLHYYDQLKKAIYLEGNNFDTYFYVTISLNGLISIL